MLRQGSELEPNLERPRIDPGWKAFVDSIEKFTTGESNYARPATLFERSEPEAGEDVGQKGSES